MSSFVPYYFITVSFMFSGWDCIICLFQAMKHWCRSVFFFFLKIWNTAETVFDSVKVRSHWFPNLNQWQKHSSSWLTTIDVFLGYHFELIVLIPWANWDVEPSKLKNKGAKSFTQSFNTSWKFNSRESIHVTREYLDYNWDKSENCPSKKVFPVVIPQLTLPTLEIF